MKYEIQLILRQVHFNDASGETSYKQENEVSYPIGDITVEEADRKLQSTREFIWNNLTNQ
jgi:hypothetical protein